MGYQILWSQSFRPRRVQMYQDAPRLAAFSPIDDSITGRVGRSGISDPIVCIGMGAILGLDEAMVRINHA